MQNRESSFERDPHLRRNDSLSQNATSNQNNKWTETMKNVPSYSEHMKQIGGGKKTNQNAFNRALGKAALQASKSNSVSRVTSKGNNNSRGVSNNAIRSATKSPSKGLANTGQAFTTNRGQSSSRTK